SARISRRRFVRGAGVSAAALGLAGCTSAASPPTAAPATAPAGASPATAASATAPATRPKYGGALKTISTSPERSLDPHTSPGALIGFGNHVCYSQLVTYKWGPEIKPANYIATGDLAESWTQPDELTYV